MAPVRNPKIPLIDKYNAPYWQGLREHQVRMPVCRSCGHVQYPMGPCCSVCLVEEFDWTTLSGKGSIWSYVIYHHAFHPAFKDDLPYNVTEIALDEGPKVIANVVGIQNEQIQNGMRVRACFDPIDGDFTLLRFEPDADAETAPAAGVEA